MDSDQEAKVLGAAETDVVVRVRRFVVVAVGDAQVVRIIVPRTAAQHAPIQLATPALPKQRPSTGNLLVLQ